MKLLIAGSRTITDYDVFRKLIKEIDFSKVTEIISGHANGIDKLGEKLSEDMNIPVKLFPANWELYGKSAGYKRNKEMVDYCDCALIIWDGISKGTLNTIELLMKSNKKWILYRI